jgi:hypothetical protein
LKVQTCPSVARKGAHDANLIRLMDNEDLSVPSWRLRIGWRTSWSQSRQNTSLKQIARRTLIVEIRAIQTPSISIVPRGV